MNGAPHVKFFRNCFSCIFVQELSWKLGQVLVGGLLAFLGVGSLFFFRGVPDFHKQGRFYPSVPPPFCTAMTGEQYLVLENLPTVTGSWAMIMPKATDSARAKMSVRFMMRSCWELNFEEGQFRF